jgi:sodium transport system permease protein
MRWSIIRVIWLRELRDQLRDRRTLFMIAVLPLLLYPVLGFVVVQLAVGFVEKSSVVGIHGWQHLPALTPRSAGLSPIPLATWLGLAPPVAVGSGLPVDRLAGGAGLIRAGVLFQDYPPLLLQDESGRWRFAGVQLDSPDLFWLQVKLLGSDNPATLEARQVDLILSVPPDFSTLLVQGRRPALQVQSREGDDRSRLASSRLYSILGRWKQRLKEVRLAHSGLPANYDDPVEISDPEKDKTPAKQAAEGLFELMIRVFPFLLVMWSLAGALYPAVDLCAGEKERGTMETLLISPASREEIVWGKFLTICVFSTATALLNLASMALTTWQFSRQLPLQTFAPAALVWCVLLLLPMSAFFSAICLSVGAYARSSKEGQYYLMPLFLITMPLSFLTLAPGVELNPFYSLVPVTGVALLMQKLMTTAALDQVPWLYFVPVLAPVVLYSWLALRWAIEQFKREEVLFREAERLDLGLWLRRLVREKEPLPTAGMAWSCFALILFLRSFLDGAGAHLSPLVRMGLLQVFVVAGSAIVLALLLTSRPVQGLALRLPSAWTVLNALLLAGLLLLPLAELTRAILAQFPDLVQLLSERQPLVEELRALRAGLGQTAAWQYLLTLALLPAVCEELAFRGFILVGLRRRYGPWTAICLSSLLFSLYHLNVFQFLPSLVLGVVLGMLATRSASVLPGMVFHLMHNGLLVGVAMLPTFEFKAEGTGWEVFLRLVMVGLSTLLAVLLLSAIGARLSALGKADTRAPATAAGNPMAESR